MFSRLCTYTEVSHMGGSGAMDSHFLLSKVVMVNCHVYFHSVNTCWHPHMNDWAHGWVRTVVVLLLIREMLLYRQCCISYRSRHSNSNITAVETSCSRTVESENHRIDDKPHQPRSFYIPTVSIWHEDSDSKELFSQDGLTCDLNSSTVKVMNPCFVLDE